MNSSKQRNDDSSSNNEYCSLLWQQRLCQSPKRNLPSLLSILLVVMVGFGRRIQTT